MVKTYSFRTDSYFFYKDTYVDGQVTNTESILLGALWLDIDYKNEVVTVFGQSSTFAKDQLSFSASNLESLPCVVVGVAGTHVDGCNSYDYSAEFDALVQCIQEQLSNATSGSAGDQIGDLDSDTAVVLNEAANDSIDFIVDGTTVMTLTDTKLTMNGIFIDPPTGLELVPQAAIPAQATDPTHTLWLNSTDGDQLYLGSSPIGGGTNTYVASGAVAGTDLTLTLNDASTVVIDVTSLVTDVKVSSGVYNAGTEAIDFTLSDATTVSVPVSALLVSTTDDTIDGDGSTATPLTITPSTDAGNTLTLGTDGKLLVPAGTETSLVLTTDGTATGVTLSGTADHTVDILLVSADANNLITAGTDGGLLLPLDASGFTGNLATTDDTLQEVADKFDAYASPTLVVTTDGNSTGVTHSGTEDHTVDLVLLSTDANNALSSGTDGGLLLPLDASGFTGNLATTDDTLQEVADKFDAFSIASLERIEHVTPTGTNTLPNLSEAPSDPTKVKFYVNGVLDYAGEISSDAAGVVTVAGTFNTTYEFDIETTDTVSYIYFV